MVIQQPKSTTRSDVLVSGYGGLFQQEDMGSVDVR